SPAPSNARAGNEAFELSAPALVQAGDEIEAVLRVAAGGRMQGFSVQLGWDASVIAPLAAAGAGLVEGQGGVVLSPGPGGVDAALLGVGGSGIAGSGAAARFRFRALRDGAAGLKIARVLARDFANRPLD